MSTPILFLGAGESGALAAADEGYADMGVAYTASARSNPAYPGSDAGECIFSKVHLSLAHRIEPAAEDPADEVDITVIPVVDEVEVGSFVFTIRLTPIAVSSEPPARVRRPYEIPILVPYVRDMVERARYAPRGRGFALKITWPACDVSVDGASVEYEIVSNSRRAAS